jgi:predicted nucleic acid-binding protein
MFILSLKRTRDQKLLEKKAEIVRNVNLEPVLKVFEIIDILPADKANEEQIVEMIRQYGLLPNDALIAATCKHYGSAR